MRWVGSRAPGRLAVMVVVSGSLALPGSSWAQSPAAPRPAEPRAAGIQAIEDEYQRQLLQLDQRRIEQLVRLAASQSKAEAAATYEHLFRLAIAGNLFRNAEAAAVQVLEQGTPSPVANGLAHLVRIIAEADRGAFEASLKSIRAAIAENAGNEVKAGRAQLSSDEILGICDAYYQRLVEAGQFSTAVEAFRAVLEKSQNPAVKEFLEGRLKRLELVGKPAPGIAGPDVDGKTFDLAATRGKAVLLVFWASWCVPNSAQVEWLQEVDAAYRDKGLRIVGIDVDAQQDGGTKLETILPNVRRFILDHNIRWTNLINGTGERDYARAYGIADIPANVLIGPDGKVVQVDLTRRNLDATLSRLLAR